MVTVIYDGTFEGFLTAVFEVYEYKMTDVEMYTTEKAPRNIFNNVHNTSSSDDKAMRVWRGLKNKITSAALNQLYRAFLSGLPGIEDTLLRYVQYTFSSKLNVEHDYSNADVLKIKQTDNKVRREKHRMEAFIRFQLTRDGIYYAICQPDYNVLPLIIKHFKDRYADQRWLIYDSARKYGIYYNLNTVETVELTFDPDVRGEKTSPAVFDGKEELYQRLWQQYFKSVNIEARKNTKLHIRHMPKRYWKNLVEKQ